MIQSAELDQLFTALAEFQSRVGAIPKEATNPFFKSKYAALPSVVAAASPILTECGLCVSQHLGHDAEGDTLTTIVGHKSGQHIGDTMHLRPIKDDPQAQGSATSYGRRYAYMAALGLVADDDDDGNAASRGAKVNGAERKKPSPLSESNRAKVLKAFADAGINDLTLYFTAVGLERVEDMTAEHAVKLRGLLDKEIAEREAELA